METVREPGRLKGIDFLRWVSLVLNDTSFTNLVPVQFRKVNLSDVVEQAAPDDIESRRFSGKMAGDLMSIRQRA
jgi:hypothetical protein